MGEPKSGVSTISLGRLQCVRRDSTAPHTEEEEIKTLDIILGFGEIMLKTGIYNYRRVNCIF
jgi:hypothetical protein